LTRTGLLMEGLGFQNKRKFTAQLLYRVRIAVFPILECWPKPK